MDMKTLRQETQETSGEHEARLAGNFPHIESRLPLRWPTRSSHFLKGITSYLGRRNPLARPATAKGHIVWLFDNIAYRPVHPYPHKAQPWQMHVVASIFENDHRDISKYVADVADIAGIGKHDEETRKRIETRLQPFLYSIAPARTITLQIPGLTTAAPETPNLKPSDEQGIISETVGFNSGKGVPEGTTITSQLANWTPNVSMETIYAHPEGWLFISDIDDSIKYTQTSDATGILRTTFADVPQPIAGMPEFYAHVQKEFDPRWVYLSASPYNLYRFLHGFLRTYYSPGTIILRENSWQDLGGLLRSFTQGTQAYKVSRMEKIHEWLPQRKVLCLGDSTQSDPEAYAEIYRKYPGWVQAIFIRKVTNIQHMEKKNADERFQKAFEGVPSNIWKVFEDPKELYELVDQVKAHPDNVPTSGVQKLYAGHDDGD